MKTFELLHLEDWQHVVDELLPSLEHPILLLKGNLGAGKTTFTQFLLRGLGSQDEVTSPTYSMVNEYHSPKGNIYHFDLYRMRDKYEAFDMGIEEYLADGALSIIEWPEIYEEELCGLSYHEMQITYHDQKRSITFK